jgi:predicted methyltransferase
MRTTLLLASAALLIACHAKEQPVAEVETPSTVESVERNLLDDVLLSQPDDVKARYPYRHPKETLEFFGIEPGMTVMEGLPGSGWYSRLLVPYLGADGHLIGGNYSLLMYPLFPFADDAFMERQRQWAESFPAGAKEWGDARVSTFHFGSMPEELAGTADVVFFPRVLHNLARFQNAGEGDYLDMALADAFAVLKPGSVFGVVQHHARDKMSDEFASGGSGYLKKDFVISAAEAAGFEFVAESDINANPADQPTEDDVVWRLPPSYSGSRDDEEAKAAVDAIGESNRMTLKFRKPE